MKRILTVTDSTAINGNTTLGEKASGYNRVLKPGQSTQKKFEQLMSSVQDKVEKLAQEVSERGYFKNKGEADWLFENNTNPNLKVSIDASNLTVNISDGDGWFIDKERGGKTAWGETGNGETFNSDFQIHGTVAVNKSNEQSRILTEKYDFDMKSWKTHAMRNIKTLIAKPAGGHGTPYYIEYRGTPNVK